MSSQSKQSHPLRILMAVLSVLIGAFYVYAMCVYLYGGIGWETPFDALVFAWVLAVLDYVLPVFLFIRACRAGKDEDARQKKWEKVFYFLFTLTYLVMTVHVLYQGFFSDISFYWMFFTDPVYYPAPLALFALMWLAARKKPKKATDGLMTKFFYILSVLSVIGTLAYCAFLCGKYSLYPPQGSAPWILEPLLYCLMGVAVAAVFLCLSLLCRRIGRKGAEKAEITE